jgi:hypothetical protein
MLSHRLCDDNAFQGIAKAIRIMIARPAPHDGLRILLNAALSSRKNI